MPVTASPEAYQQAALAAPSTMYGSPAVVTELPIAASQISSAADPTTAPRLRALVEPAPQPPIANGSNAPSTKAASTQLHIATVVHTGLEPTPEAVSMPVPTVAAQEVSTQATLPPTVDAAHSAPNLEPVSSVPHLSEAPEVKTLHAGAKHASAGANDKAHAKAATDSKQSGRKAEAKGKERAVERQPRTLLQLPVDILQLIAKELGHSNDLAAVARTCSTLYTHAIPILYSTFDIVWYGTPAEEPRGVDALSYGLSTLCAGSSFARTVHRLRAYVRRGRASKDRSLKFDAKPSALDFPTNDYAKYTRKFSLGNGPVEDINKYNINRERGKMLGTLAALSVAKMCSLENFVWDMPTGVLSDVFLALASLPDFYPDSGECKLSRVWVRWHNKTAILSDDSRASSRSATPDPTELAGMLGTPNFVVQGSTMTDMGIKLPPHGSYPPARPTIPYAESAVPFPTFSVLPPVKSVTALDIDDISYLDELAILIEKSHARLEVLRISIAAYAVNEYFVQPWDGPGLKQVDLDACWPGENTICDQRLGGVMGILVGRLYDLRQGSQSVRTTADAATETVEATTTEAGQLADVADNTAGGNAGAEAQGSSSSLARLTPSTSNGSNASKRGDSATAAAVTEAEPVVDNDGILNTKLKLTKLELERVPISMVAITSALDWSTITSLTLLSCPQQDGLWRYLRKHFRPTAVASTESRRWSNPGARNYNYHLSLTSLHTDNVRSSLLQFIRETLRPNSLETLFIQRHAKSPNPRVGIEDVFYCAVKPHSESLTKLLLNGDLRKDASDDDFDGATRSWDVSRDVLRYMLGGRMRQLRELSLSVAYADWHLFLQMLPGLPHLTALHVQHISKHATEKYAPRECALQIADIVTLRMEMKLSFIGVAHQCFEVIEVIKGADGAELHDHVRRSRRSSIADSTSASDSDSGSDDGHHGAHGGDNDGDSGSDSDGESVHGGGNAFGFADYDSGSEFSLAVDDDDDDADDGDVAQALRAPRVRLRAIMFCDEIVAIFKARHGRL